MTPGDVEHRMIIKVDEEGTQRFYHPETKQLHRIDGPAIIHSNGSEIWCQNGRYHREDGPAVIYADGEQQWWLNDIKMTELQFDRLTRTSPPLKSA